jgi:hypothetical protein
MSDINSSFLSEVVCIVCKNLTVEPLLVFSCPSLAFPRFNAPLSNFLLVDILYGKTNNIIIQYGVWTILCGHPPPLHKALLF